MVSFLSPTVQLAQLRSKAVYALSGLCKHNSEAVKQLGESQGWEHLSTALEGLDPRSCFPYETETQKPKQTQTLPFDARSHSF